MLVGPASGGNDRGSVGSAIEDHRVVLSGVGVKTRDPVPDLVYDACGYVRSISSQGLVI